MKNMKKLIYITLILAATTIVFSSCGKYEEGPAISLLSKTARITGEWVLDSHYYNGEEQELTEYDNVVVELLKDGTGTLEAPFFGNTTLSIDLEWEFDGDKENLRTRIKDPDTGSWQSWEESKILMLKNNEMWLEREEIGELSGETVTVKEIYVAK
jgi:hypothetical protein